MKSSTNLWASVYWFIRHLFDILFFFPPSTGLWGTSQIILVQKERLLFIYLFCPVWHRTPRCHKRFRARLCPVWHCPGSPLFHLPTGQKISALWRQVNGTEQHAEMASCSAVWPRTNHFHCDELMYLQSVPFPPGVFFCFVLFVLFFKSVITHWSRPKERIDWLSTARCPW